jgi:hypothetical protein
MQLQGNGFLDSDGGNCPALGYGTLFEDLVPSLLSGVDEPGGFEWALKVIAHLDGGSYVIVNWSARADR